MVRRFLSIPYSKLFRKMLYTLPALSMLSVSILNITFVEVWLCGVARHLTRMVSKSLEKEWVKIPVYIYND